MTEHIHAGKFYQIRRKKTWKCFTDRFIYIFHSSRTAHDSQLTNPAFFLSYHPICLWTNWSMMLIVFLANRQMLSCLLSRHLAPKIFWAVPYNIHTYIDTNRKHKLQRGKEHSEHCGKIQPQGKSKYHQNKLTSSRTHICWPGSPLVIDFPLRNVSACDHFDYFYRLNFPCVLFVC